MGWHARVWQPNPSQAGTQKSPSPPKACLLPEKEIIIIIIITIIVKKLGKKFQLEKEIALQKEIAHLSNAQFEFFPLSISGDLIVAVVNAERVLLVPHARRYRQQQATTQ